MIFRNPLKLLFYLCLLVVFLLVGYKTYLNLFTEDFEGVHTEQVERIYQALEPGEPFSFAVVGNINNSVGIFEDRIIPELIELHRISTEATEAHRSHLRSVLREYVEETGSEWGGYILDNFDAMSRKFWLVKPKAASLENLLKSTRANPA